MNGHSGEIILRSRLDQALVELERAQMKATTQEWVALREELDRLRSKLEMKETYAKAPGNQTYHDTLADDDTAGAIAAACTDWPFADIDYYYDFFISYNPEILLDSRLALELYFRLQLHEVAKITRHSDDESHTPYENTPAISIPFRKKVFLDSETLGKGEDWRTGIEKGLKRSEVVVLLISRASLQCMENSDRRVDNILLEFETAILASRKNKCVVVPVFIGENGIRFDASDLLSPNLPSKRFSPNPNAMQCHLSARTTLAEIANMKDAPKHYIDHPTLKDSINECVAHIVSFHEIFSEPEFARERAVASAKDILVSLRNRIDGTWTSEKCKLTVELTSSEFELFTNVIALNTSWKHLDLSKQSLRGNQPRVLAMAMKANGRLETLNLKRNEAGDDSARMLSDALKSNTALQNHLMEPDSPRRQSNGSNSSSDTFVNTPRRTLSSGRLSGRLSGDGLTQPLRSPTTRVNSPTLRKPFSTTDLASRKAADRAKNGGIAGKTVGKK